MDQDALRVSLEVTRRFSPSNNWYPHLTNIMFFVRFVSTHILNRSKSRSSEGHGQTINVIEKGYVLSHSLCQSPWVKSVMCQRGDA